MADPVYKGTTMVEPPYCNKAGQEEITRLRSDNQKLREALLRIAFGGASGEVDDLAGNPLLWSSTTAYLALGGRIEGGTRLDSRELLSGLDSAPRTGEESKSGVDVAEEAKGGL